MIWGRWQAQKTARMYLNESRAILAEMKLGPLEKTIAPFRIFSQNSNPRTFETLEPLQSNRPSSVKRGLGGLGRKRKISKVSKKAAGRKKKGSWCPSGPGQGLGSGPPGQGGTIVRERPLLCVVDFREFFFFPNCLQLCLLSCRANKKRGDAYSLVSCPRE